ncbi:response regulator [Salibacterium sp. K-3]
MIKLLLVDDHFIVINGLKYFFQTQENIQIVGHALNGEDAIQKVEALRPDIILMDIVMPDMSGVEATKRIKENFPDSKVIVLTGFSDRDSIVEVIKAGAIGYQLKDVDPDILMETIITAMEGKKTIHPEVANKLVTLLEDDTKAQHRLHSLTNKEKEVLYHITLGKSNKEIAAELGITYMTVKTHISRILGKMEVQDRTQAAIYALRNKWFDSPGPCDQSD